MGRRHEPGLRVPARGPQWHDTVEAEETFVAALDAIGLPSAVVRGEHHRTDDRVQARGVTASGGDGDAHGSLCTSQLLDSLQDFSGLGVAPQGLLGEHQLAVYGYLEEPTRRLYEFDLAVGEGALQFSRQTGGSGLVVSNYTVQNGYMHDEHLSLVPRRGRRES